MGLAGISVGSRRADPDGWLEAQLPTQSAAALAPTPPCPLSILACSGAGGSPDAGHEEGAVPALDLHSAGLPHAHDWPDEDERFWTESLGRLADHLTISTRRTTLVTMTQATSNDAPVLRLSRSFAAPRDRVFRAFTAPAQLARWWGPKGFTVPACTLDVRAGGVAHGHALA